MLKNNDELLKCSICGKTIEPNGFGWRDGNNAQPVNDGRCCDLCNFIYVIPARVNQKKTLE